MTDANLRRGTPPPPLPFIDGQTNNSQTHSGGYGIRARPTVKVPHITAHAIFHLELPSLQAAVTEEELLSVRCSFDIHQALLKGKREIGRRMNDV